MTRLREFPFPLPPLAEQKRIVAKVDELMAFCDELEAQQQERRAVHVRLNEAALDRLTTAEDETADGTEYVINMYRNPGAHPRTQMARIVRQAGLTPWPRIFHNLRSTRQTELEEQFPSHVVCRWIGNSQQVAQKHYLQVTDDHYQRAVTAAGDLAFVVDQPSGVHVFDVSEPTAPVVLGVHTAQQAPARSVTVNGDRAYVVYQQTGLVEVIDVENPSTLEVQ